MEKTNDTVATIAIDSGLFEAVRMMIDMKVIEAESVGLFVEELLQKEIQRRKAELRKSTAEGAS